MAEKPLQCFCTGLAIENYSLISLQAPPLNGKGQVNHQAHSGGYVVSTHSQVNAKFFIFSSFLILKNSMKIQHTND